MNTSGDIVTVTQSLVDVAEAFIEIATMLRSLPGVLSVTQPCSMRREGRLGEDQFAVGEGPGFRIEWYADAMFADGQSLSFAEGVSWHEGEWTIEASVTMSRDDDEERLVDLPTRFAVDPDDLVAELGSQTRQLLDSRDSVIRRFDES